MTLPEFAPNLTIDRSEPIPGSNGAHYGYSDAFPGRKFLVIPIKEEFVRYRPTQRPHGIRRQIQEERERKEIVRELANVIINVDFPQLSGKEALAIADHVIESGWRPSE